MTMDDSGANRSCPYQTSEVYESQLIDPPRPLENLGGQTGTPMMYRTAIQTGQSGSIPLWSYLFLFSEVIESCADGPCPAEAVRD